MQTAILRTYSPELGDFYVTGLEDELKPVQRLWKGRSVSESTFDKLVYGRSKRFVLF